MNTTLSPYNHTIISAERLHKTAESPVTLPQFELFSHFSISMAIINVYNSYHGEGKKMVGNCQG
jgi:hypothetical protein